MSSLATLTELPDISIFDDWSRVKQAVQNWSVRDKFTFRTPCKDDKRARYVCTQKDCKFRVTGNKDRSGRITVKVVNRVHTCGPRNPDGPPPDLIDGPVETQENQSPTLNADQDGNCIDHPKDAKYRNPATQMKWLVTAIERVLEITTDTKPHDIQAAATEYYNEQISYQQAFRCLRILTANIKEHGHRERVPDELRKAIVALRVFVDPPMDWMEIERKTGIKARTAGYIFTSAEKKSGGSRDPFILLKNATVSPSGPKKAEGPITKAKAIPHSRKSLQNAANLQSPVSTGEFPPQPASEALENQWQSRKRRRQDDMIDPNLDVAVELARAAADMDRDGIVTHSAETSNSNGQRPIAGGEQLAERNQLPATIQSARRMAVAGRPVPAGYANGSGVEERVLNVLGGQG